MSEISDKIKKFRQKSGKSRTEVSKELCIAYSSLAKYESGERTPDVVMLSKIADIFEVSMDDFVSRKYDPQKDIKDKLFEYDPEEDTEATPLTLAKLGTQLDEKDLKIIYNLMKLMISEKEAEAEKAKEKENSRIKRTYL